MFVVVVGARERKAKEDEEQVQIVMDRLRKKYVGLVIVSAACDSGIGCFVKSRCLRKSDEGGYDFRFIELTQRIYADLPKMRMMQVFMSRNSWLAELGDEFHVFLDPGRRETTVEDLLKRLEGSNRTVYTYLPGEDPAAFIERKGQMA